MKYIKKFEYLNEDVQIGDKVICIDDSQSDNFLTYEYVYIIENIRYGFIFLNQYKLKGVDFYWDSTRFKIGTSEEIERLEIKQNSNKYNL